jgi:hypothetical protein
VKFSSCFRRVLRPSSGAQSCIHSIGYLPGLTATCRCRGSVGLQTSTNSSTTATDSSQAWQVSNAVYTVLSSWWWAEDPPETCREFHRNKYIVQRCIWLVILEKIHFIIYAPRKFTTVLRHVVSSQFHCPENYVDFLIVSFSVQVIFMSVIKHALKFKSNLVVIRIINRSISQDGLFLSESALLFLSAGDTYLTGQDTPVQESPPDLRPWIP